MSERDQENAGDYGYDLVHEEVGQPRKRGDAPAPHADAHRTSGRPAPVEAERANDLGYDEAHGF
jgi:hypothetical protein